MRRAKTPMEGFSVTLAIPALSNYTIEMKTYGEFKKEVIRKADYILS